ncbi:4'-phosphopantetheinyl transferase superfamily protein [Gilvimarinus agarilyticus]|uniref:4'-phosphopantetheinyl transferase family protein n=1 Tax=Reichenbachiella agariperforans TaxID=156994 RepID=UPI001C099798|nr:4'-phosphopantetheinyl transferase superfamily protein [Reichenbachiella agariperforans]MBU2885837.1 4'-phosphopantetheinyl transferase superfamily protein [Gilvimarinus agarilyticus]MBU2915220.1 4'-phosphopantetheinyl transferase superfamily protein [Reichenbachiella agariperforans]
MINLSLPEGVHSSFSDLSHTTDVLFESEKHITQDYDPKRLQEFCSGRYCAHQCLDRLDTRKPILKTKEGVPIWPKAVTGSISHSTKLSGAIASSTKTIGGIGLDIETIGRISPDMWAILYTNNEIDLLKRTAMPEVDFLSTLIFSMKEAFYKMQFPISGLFMDFQDCEITLLNEKCHIQPLVSLCSPLTDPAQYDIGYLRLETEVITYVLLRPLEEIRIS